MNKSLVTFAIPALIISFVILGTTSCCFGPASLVSSLADSGTSEISSAKIPDKNPEKILEEAGSVPKAWIKDGNGKLVWEPSSVMNLKVSQDANTDKYFDVSKPVIFSVESDLLAPGGSSDESKNSSESIQNSGSDSSSTDSSSIAKESGGTQAGNTDGIGSGKVEFKWDFGNGETARGQNIEYTFAEPGIYTITLTASAGSASDTYIETIWVAENSGNFLIFNKYDCIAEVESVFTNNGPGKLIDVTYSLDIPKTIQPMQEVIGVSTESGQFKEKSTTNGDLFYTFYLGEIQAGKTVSVKADYKVIISDFVLNENPDDIIAPEGEDFDTIAKEFTKSEKYIDSDSDIIKTAAAEIIGQGTDPLIVAEKLYNFVCANMEYDWERFAAPDRKNFKASELLDIRKGVCEDYTILYAALCRASGIPVKYIAGLPVMSIAREADDELESSHAWNEIYIKGYGWIPVDATSEIGFLSTNSLLNLRTYSEFQPKALGYSWTYENKQPGFNQQYFYRVSGFDESRIVAITMEEYRTMKNDTSAGN